MDEDGNRNKLVMIIDDDRDVREAIIDVLADASYQPLSARDGQDALDQLGAATALPCLILLDVMMPGMDGWGFRQVQSADPRLGAIPVVVLTAHTNASQTAKRMHAAGSLKKPVELEELLAIVDRFCSAAPGTA
jgi:CheY-like chemotaxis protein